MDVVFEPPAGGGQADQVGQEADIAGLDPGAKGPTCHYSPSSPRGYIGLSTFLGLDAAAQGVLDGFSATHATAPGAARNEVGWNVRSGQLSWGQDGADPFDGPAHWAGADGEVWFSPRLA